MLGSPVLPDVAPKVAALFDGRYIPGVTPVGDVTAFLQLTTAVHGTTGEDLHLLRSPRVRRAAVWLDGIMGRYDSVFLPTDADFLDYQLGIEKLGCSSQIVALSDASRSELPPNLGSSTQIRISGSRAGLTPLDAVSARRSETDPPYCVVVGNALPHKNAAGGVVAFAASRRARRAHMTLMVAVGGLDVRQREALVHLMRAVGADTSCLVFLPELKTPDLAGLIQRAEAVIVPSLHEGFSLPVVEAIGLGTPVVASDIPAHRELLGRDPLLADPNDPVALARSLDETLARRHDVIVRQQSALERHYDASRFDRVFCELTASLLQAPGEPWSSLTAVGARTATRTHAVERPGTPKSTAFLSHSKICNLEDFSHTDLLVTLRRHFAHEIARFGAGFPTGHEWRKYWEIAMAMRTFEDAGLLDEPHDFLGVGAGNEPTIFLLTQYARRVVASDLYLEGGWKEVADASMLTDPGWHWPFAWQPNRLQVAHMDGRDLRFPDESFHGIFSSSSIEHFGDHEAIARCLDEMHRVLAPGGTLSISSEYRISGPCSGIPGTALFTARDINELFVGDRAWTLVDSFDDTLSPATLGTEIDFLAALEDQQRQIDEVGGYWTHLIEFATYPHIVLSRPPYLFTSFHVALRKEN